MKTIAYNNKKLRTIGSFVAAVYIVFHGRPINLVKAFSSKGFYLALAVSFMISLLLVYAIHKVTVWLDKRYDWRTMPFTRSVMQFAFGIVAPALTDLMLISVYFHSLGRDIVNSGFLLIDFPVIVAFIVIFNLYYLIRYLLLTELKPAAMLECDREGLAGRNENQDSSGNAILNVHYNGQHLKFDVTEDIVYFYRAGKLVKAFTVHGNEYAVNISIAVLEKQFQSADFYRINRSVLVNCTAVRGYIVGEKRDSFKIIFKPQFRDLVGTEERNFYITKEYLPLFRERFNKL